MAAQIIKNSIRRLPCWSGGKESPANAVNTGSFPGPERFHMSWGYWARVPQLLSLCALEPALTQEKPPNEKPVHHS